MNLVLPRSHFSEAASRAGLAAAFGDMRVGWSSAVDDLVMSILPFAAETEIVHNLPL